MRRLIIFLKAPKVGMVKTRLAAEIGEVDARAAYETMVNTLVSNLSRLQPVELCYSPPDARTAIERWRRPGWTVRPQAPGDLGARLAEAFRSAFNDGARQVAIIGSDCPWVKVTDVEAAWAALDAHELVLGPAVDGGFWLIGLRSSVPLPARLFAGVPWSTSRAMAMVCANAREARLSLHRLRTLADIDTARDWRRFLAATKAP